MMYPRLVLLHELLAENGSLWMSIDDNEVHHARAILDEIFGEQNFVATVIWQKIFSPKKFSPSSFGESRLTSWSMPRSSEIWPRNLLPRTEAQDERYKNPDNDPRGPWASE